MAGFTLEEAGIAPVPPCPAELAYTLTWFWELSAQRASAFAGVDPLAWTEIDAWARLTRREPLRAIEAAAITLLDREFRAAVAKAPKTKPGKEG